MQLEVGKIYEGKVTGITKFGAFVEFDKDTTGMVHISEVANTFVNDINDFLDNMTGEVIDIKYQVSIGVFSEEQIFCFSAMIVYTE